MAIIGAWNAPYGLVCGLSLVQSVGCIPCTKTQNPCHKKSQLFAQPALDE